MYLSEVYCDKAHLMRQPHPVQVPVLTLNMGGQIDNNTSPSLTPSTGAPQCCVLSPMLASLDAHECGAPRKQHQQHCYIHHQQQRHWRSNS